MSGKPKSEPMTTEMILLEAERKRTTSKLYKAENQEISNVAISKSVRNAIKEIKRAENTSKISLDDVQAVKQITQAYLECCAVESCFPSMTGLSMALGHTRQSVYHHMKVHQNTESGQFLTQVHDLLADILSENALKGNANNITSIFLLKSLYGMRETENIAIEVSQTYEDEYDNRSDDFKKRYRNLIPE